ncbi:MAG: hypothetical protein Q7U82_00900 [Gammaproteobacteria bacterium]|nr:hypothetical protein [Gammaproteobacteria bacterium]
MPAQVNVKKVLAGSSMLALSVLVIWRLLYEVSAYSWLVLIPLLVACTAGSYLGVVQSRQAYLDAALTQDTWLRKWLKGRAYAMFTSVVFGFTATLFIGYKALVVTGGEFVLLSLFFAGSVVVYCRQINTLHPHVNTRYLPTMSASITLVLAGSVSALLYGFYVANETIPGELRNAGFSQIWEFKVQSLPQGTGLIAKFMELFVTIDAIELYAVVHGSTLTSLVAPLYLINSVAVAYVIVRFAAAISEFLRSLFMSRVVQNEQQ